MANKRIKDYHKHKQDIKNPFIKRKKKKRRVNWKKVFGFLLFIALIGGVGWWLFFSGFWNIDKIEIKGASRTPQEDIRQKAWQQSRDPELMLLSQRNLFLFNKEDLIGELKDQYHFPEVEVNKKIPNKLLIELKEGQCAYILQEQDNYYKIDGQNYVISRRKDIKNQGVPLIKNIGVNKKITGDRSYVKKDYISYITGLHKALEQKTSELEIKNFILDNQIPDMEEVEKNTIKMQIQGGPMIYLNMELEPTQQIKKLLLLKQNELKDDFLNKEYIILKYGDRIFYK